MTSQRTRRRRHTQLILLALVSAGLLAGCGSSSSGATATTTKATGATTSGTRATLASCLRKHGVTLPAGGGPSGTPNGPPPAGAPGGAGPPAGGPPGGAGNAKVQAALRACGGGRLPAGGGPGAAIPRKRIQAFVACVRQHGYRLASPNLSGKGSVLPANVQSNKKFVAASRSCQGLLTGPGVAAATATGSS